MSPQSSTSLSSPVLVHEIITTGKKVSSIEAKIDQFLYEQASLKTDVKAIRQDVDDLISSRKGDRRFIAGIAVVLSPLMAVGVTWLRNFFGV